MRTILIILIATIAAIMGTSFYLKQQGVMGGDTAGTKKETAYERVIRTGTIRCGYGVGAPYVEMDPNTKKMRGFAVDVMEAIGKNLNLKVEWTEETGWGGIIPALNEGRVDVGCSSMWTSAPKSREALLSIDYLYNTMFFWVRVDDDRFETIQDLKNKNAKMVLLEGDPSEVITQRMFTNGNFARYNKEFQVGQIFLEIATNKADSMLLDPGTVAEYNAKADVKLRAVSPDKPATTIGNSFPVGKTEIMLKNMIDTAIAEMVANGELAQIMKPYQDATPNAYYLPSQPYAP